MQDSNLLAPPTVAPQQQAEASPVAQELSGSKSKRRVKQGSKEGTAEGGRQLAVQMAREAAAQDARKQATHVGRFKKFARGKCVKGYSSNDLAAILGGGGQLQPQQVSDASWLSHKPQDRKNMHVKGAGKGIRCASFSGAYQCGGAASSSQPVFDRTPLADWRGGVH